MRGPNLLDIPLLREATPEALRDIADAIDWFSLPSGWTLFDEGEEPDGLYFVVGGTLCAYRKLANGERRLIGYIRPGEPVGEMALIAGEKHTACAYALRDSEVVRVSRPAFNRLVRQHPTLMQSLARVVLTRLRQQRRKRARAEPRIFCLMASSRTIDVNLRAATLQRALEAQGARVACLGPDGADTLATRLDALERTHDFVLLHAAIEDSPWFRACLRQADRIWLLARSDAWPSEPLWPEAPPTAHRMTLIDVIMLDFAGAAHAGASAETWRRAAGAERIFHWRNLEEADAERLARVIAGRAVGVVFSGGGARAYAQVGVLRAMRELNIPIDFLGGTSMGAIIAACWAMRWDLDEIDERLRRAFVESNPLGDYVLPVVALARGKRVEERLREHFGETQIEDLRTPFFCVSTNLVAGRVEIHKWGRLRDALRASISLPGIIPPVVDETRGVLVDGAVLMNFPVDVMRAQHRGPIVGVDVARRGAFDPADFVNPPSFAKWVSNKGFQRTPPIASLLMRTATLTVDPWEGRERTDVLIVPEMPNIDLRDWKMYDDGVAAGYQAALAALGERQSFFRRPAPEATDGPSLGMMEAEAAAEDLAARALRGT